MGLWSVWVPSESKIGSPRDVDRSMLTCIPLPLLPQTHLQTREEWSHVLLQSISCRQGGVQICCFHRQQLLGRGTGTGHLLPVLFGTFGHHRPPCCPHGITSNHSFNICILILLKRSQSSWALLESLQEPQACRASCHLLGLVPHLVSYREGHGFR